MISYGEDALLNELLQERLENDSEFRASVFGTEDVTPRRESGQETSVSDRRRKENRISIAERDSLVIRYGLDSERYNIFMLPDEVSPFTPRPDGVAVFLSQFVAGLKFPLEPLLVWFMTYVKVQISSIHPAAIRTIMAFAVLCRSLGCEPSFRLLKKYFTCHLNASQVVSLRPRRNLPKLFDDPSVKLSDWDSKWAWVESKAGFPFSCKALTPQCWDPSQSLPGLPAREEQLVNEIRDLVHHGSRNPRYKFVVGELLTERFAARNGVGSSPGVKCKIDMGEELVFSWEWIVHPGGVFRAECPSCQSDRLCRPPRSGELPSTRILEIRVEASARRQAALNAAETVIPARIGADKNDYIPASILREGPPSVSRKRTRRVLTPMEEEEEESQLVRRRTRRTQDTPAATVSGPSVEPAAPGPLVESAVSRPSVEPADIPATTVSGPSVEPAVPVLPVESAIPGPSVEAAVPRNLVQSAASPQVNLAPRATTGTDLARPPVAPLRPNVGPGASRPQPPVRDTVRFFSADDEAGTSNPSASSSVAPVRSLYPKPATSAEWRELRTRIAGRPLSHFNFYDNEMAMYAGQALLKRCYTEEAVIGTNRLTSEAVLGLLGRDLSNISSYALRLFTDFLGLQDELMTRNRQDISVAGLAGELNNEKNKSALLEGELEKLRSDLRDTEQRFSEERSKWSSELQGSSSQSELTRLRNENEKLQVENNTLKAQVCALNEASSSQARAGPSREAEIIRQYRESDIYEQELSTEAAKYFERGMNHIIRQVFPQVRAEELVRYYNSFFLDPDMRDGHQFVPFQPEELDMIRDEDSKQGRPQWTPPDPAEKSFFDFVNESKDP